MREKQLNQPVTHGVAKVPVIMQLEALECGAACLDMILAYYGKWIPLEKVRKDCGVSRDGSGVMVTISMVFHHRCTLDSIGCPSMVPAAVISHMPSLLLSMWAIMGLLQLS